MLNDVAAIHPLEGYQLHLIFEDNIEGIVDLAELVDFTGIFEPLQNREYFLSVRVDSDLGTICWDNGADIDPVVLYAKVSNPNRTMAELRNSVLPDLISGKTQTAENCVGNAR